MTGQLRVVCLMGPTATGKTDAALELARRYPVEIVSVDSAMVYRGLDIGTGKPSADVLAATPHHLVDILDPWERYSAGDFVRDARTAIMAIAARNHVPLLVGGTMLYFRSLFRGLADLPEAEPSIRAALDARAAAVGWPALHAELAQLDPVAAARIEPADRQRIQRALEVHALTGTPLSELQGRESAPDDLSFVRIGVAPADRAELHRRIDARWQAMLAAGFIREVAALRAIPGVSGECPAMRAVGYRQVWQHLAGGMDAAETGRQVLAATRQLARRQLTWLRREPVDVLVDRFDQDLAVTVSRAIGAR